MTEKMGFGIGIITGLAIYFFSTLFAFGNYSPYPIPVILDNLLTLLSIAAIVMGGLIVFKKIHVKTTNRGILFGLVGTVAIMEWIIGPFVLT